MMFEHQYARLRYKPVQRQVVRFARQRVNQLASKAYAYGFACKRYFIAASVAS